MKKSIYCNCGTYLGERDGFDVIRCKKCGIDYVVNPKEFINAVEDEGLTIGVTSSEDFDTVVLFLEKLTGEEHFVEYDGSTFFGIDADEPQSEMCLSIQDNEWVHSTREEEEEHNVKVISYSSVKDLIEKELDR